MRRHSFDPTSFILGLVVTGVAVVYLVAEVSDRTVEGAWVFPVALIGLGLAAVVAGLSRALRRGPQPEPVPVPTAVEAEPERSDRTPED